MVKIKLAEFILKYTPNKLKEIFVIEKVSKFQEKLMYTQLSYAQEGEDLLLNKLLGNQQKGFFIDVGANHPRRFSNTYFFYKKGWRGINIEPNPEMYHLLQLERSEDINVNIGVDEHEGELDYFMFNEPALNTFSKKEVDEYLMKKEYRLIDTIRVQVRPLSIILSELNISKGTVIDFLSVDAEGLDLNVVKSHDFKNFPVRFLLIEILNINELIMVFEHEIYHYLNMIGFELVSRTHNTFIFSNKCVE